MQDATSLHRVLGKPWRNGRNNGKRTKFGIQSVYRPVSAKKQSTVREYKKSGMLCI